MGAVDDSKQKQQVYTCLSCGKPLSGLVFYCEGCSGYLCRTCGIPEDEGSQKCKCPNCLTELVDFNF